MDEYNEKDRIGGEGEQALPEQVLPEQVLPEQVLPEQVLPEQVLPEQVLPEQVLPEQALPEGVLPEQAPEQAQVEERAADTAGPPVWQAPAESAASEPESIPESAPAEEPAPPSETAYWSSRGARQGFPQEAPPPYQEPYQQQQRSPYPPPYYSGSTPPQPGYGYNNRQSPYGQQNQGYPSVGGYQQYGTSSGWRQQPPPQPQPVQPDRYDWKFQDYDNLAATSKPEKKKRNRGVVVFTVALVSLLCVGIIALSGYSVYMATIGFDQAEERAPEASSVPDIPLSGELPESELEITARQDYSESLPVGGKMTIPQVAEAVLPSVAGVLSYLDNQMLDPVEGSGIIMNMDGHIITNAHVLEGGVGFKVQIHGGDVYDAVLVGADVMSDLAVLKIEAEGLVPAQFGDSKSVRVGETAIAIGNPGGLELAGSVTLGIVSAVNRAVNSSSSNMVYIQTDAAINPGNSGGALANEYGQVIGINSSKIVASGYEGLAFAIPISEAKPIIDELIANGRVTSRAMLGIKGEQIDSAKAQTYGERGIRIAEFIGSEDLPASGAQVGDIITHVNGERIYTLADLRSILDTKQAGDVVELTLYRRFVNQETNFTVETRLVGNDGDVTE